MSKSLDPVYVTAFIAATQHVFQTMLRQEVSFGKPVPGRLPHLDSDISGIIGMTGDVVGTVVLSLPAASAAKIVESFAGSTLDPHSDDFADAIGELVNMISGNAKAMFDGLEVRISCPSVVIGKGHTVQQPSDSVCVTIPCESSCGGFSVDVSIKEVAQKASEPAAA